VFVREKTNKQKKKNGKKKKKKKKKKKNTVPVRKEHRGLERAPEKVRRPQRRREVHKQPDDAVGVGGIGRQEKVDCPRVREHVVQARRQAHGFDFLIFFGKFFLGVSGFLATRTRKPRRPFQRKQSIPSDWESSPCRKHLQKV
jgi:hypothetical protein